MSLHIEISGSGPDLVLLHGWAMNSSIWDSLTPFLASRFKVHRVDLPGHGSSAAYVPYTLDAIADALSAGMPPQAIVCGWSLGGQLALTWALRRPAQCVRLVLIATTPCFMRGADWEHGIGDAVFNDFSHDLATDCRAALRRFSVLQASGDADARAVLRQLNKCTSAHGEPNVESLELALRILRNTDLRNRLAGIVQPALLLHGERDAVVPHAASAYCQGMMPHAVLDVIADTAHVPFLARPQQVARRITEFCFGQ